MPKDILYWEDDFVFSYRVGGVLRRGDKVLLQRCEGDYAIIGGHVSRMESTAQTLAREFMEELHAPIEVGRLMAVGEVFFPWRGRPCHQICLYYEVKLSGEPVIPLDGVFHGYDELGGERIDLDFCWVPLEEIGRSIEVYPLELMPGLLENGNEVRHVVSRGI